jgi:type III secretory pathway component EscS
MEDFRQLLIASTVFLAFGFSWSVWRIHKTSVIGLVGGAGILFLAASQLFHKEFGMLFAIGVLAVSLALYILSVRLARGVDVLAEHEMETGKDQAILDLCSRVLGKR